MRERFRLYIRCIFSIPGLSAVRFMYRYVTELKARFQMINPKRPELASQRLKTRLKVLSKFWIKRRARYSYW